MKIGNWPLLLLVLEHVIQHPEEYDQHVYKSVCGTKRCIAGWLTWHAGYRYDDDTGLYTHPYNGSVPRGVESAALFSLNLDPEIYGEVDVWNDDGVPALAELSYNLFHGNRTFDEILETVRDLARADGVTPTPVVVEEMVYRGIVTDWEAA